MPKFLINTAAALGIALACVGVAAEAKTKVAVIEASPYAVAPGSTWAWAPFTTTSADPRVANDIVQDRLAQSVETALAAKGLRQVGRPQARYLVSYHVRLANRVDPKVNGGSGGCGGRACLSRWGSTPSLDVKRYTEGYLVLDIVDANTGRLVWRAASEKKVTEKDATQAQLNKMLTAMTKSLPSA